MKKFIVTIILLLSNYFFYAQNIIKDTVQVNTSLHSVLTVKGSILKLDLGKNLAMVDDPLSNSEGTFITVKALNNFQGTDYINIINDKNEYYIVTVQYKKNIATPFFFLGKRNALKKTTIKDYKEGEVSKEIKEAAEKINNKKGDNLQRSFTKNNYVKLKVSDVFSYKDYIFLRLLIDNFGAYSFVLEGINFKISEYDTWKKTSSSEEMVTPLFRTNTVVTVKPKEQFYVTFIFNAFKIPKNRFLKISLQEKYLNSEYFIDLEGNLINEPKEYSEKTNFKTIKEIQ